MVASERLSIEDAERLIVWRDSIHHDTTTGRRRWAGKESMSNGLDGACLQYSSAGASTTPVDYVAQVALCSAGEIAGHNLITKLSHSVH